jgi:hypothetical protein
MGIYSCGKIYGIIIYKINDHDDLSNTLFERKYDVIMNDEQKREAYLFYAELLNKENILFRVYTECTNTMDINKKNCMTWFPISLNVFLEKFRNLSVTDFRGFTNAADYYYQCEQN